jgi:DNA-binding MurR/RpiR family transcriptional regulator
MAQEPVLFSQLKDRSKQLSKNQRVLAKHIVENYQAVAFSNLRQLSSEAGVSEATIVRFAKVMDFKGYPELQKEIRRIVRADMKGGERFRLTYAGRQTGRKGPLSAIIEREIDNISSLQATLDQKAFRQAALALRAASEILVIGTRSTAPLAHHLWFGLDKIRLKATRFVAITTETYDHRARLDARAQVVVIGFPRYLRELREVLEFSKRARVKTLVITDSPFAALHGDINLHAPAESAAFVASHCAPLILINGLLHAVSLLDKARTLDALNRFEVLADNRSYFCTT